MSPPRRGVAVFRPDGPEGNRVPLGEGSWIRIPGSDEGAEARLFKVIPKLALEERLRKRGEPWVAVLEITSPGDRSQVIENQGDRVRSDFILEDLELQGYAYGAEDGRKGVYVTGPGPSPSSDAGFLPLSLVISFFFMWAISAPASLPAWFGSWPSTTP